ncbi:MAG: HesB/IscA family protein [Bacteroidota bacterium]
MMPPVTISKKAIEEIKQILKAKKVPTGYGLRVGVKGGGCAATLILGFDEKQENDIEYNIDEISVFIQKKETMFVIGKEVDFYEGADRRGFLFKDQEVIKEKP